nr:MAG TPA: hypothetical protein [Caudoviricetes sp.]
MHISKFSNFLSQFNSILIFLWLSQGLLKCVKNQRGVMFFVYFNRWKELCHGESYEVR